MKLNNYVIKILDQKGAGLRSVFQQCLFREVLSELYIIHSFKYLCTYSSAAFLHLALLKTKCYLLGWNWIHSTSSNLSENYHFPCKRGMHSNSLHNAFRSIPWKDGAKVIQQNLASKFLKHSQIFVHNSLWLFSCLILEHSNFVWEVNAEVITQKQELIFMCAHFLSMNPCVCTIWEQKYRKEDLKMHLIINFLLFRAVHIVEAGLEHVLDLVKHISKVNINMREIIFRLIITNFIYLPTPFVSQNQM